MTQSAADQGTYVTFSNSLKPEQPPTRKEVVTYCQEYEYLLQTHEKENINKAKSEPATSREPAVVTAGRDFEAP